ncbi:MAG: hydroxyphenylacetyl-CoA thioesterase PaaI, partial [Ferruginibacter sp.]
TTNNKQQTTNNKQQTTNNKQLPTTPHQVVTHMMQQDLFSQWLGIQVLDVKEGYSKISMKVREEMINGFGIVHGGIAFSLADSAFAFACNNRNVLSVALDTSINFIKPVHVGDELIAEAKELHNGRSTGLYHITISNQNDHVVALFKGTCFRTNKSLM